MRADVLKYGDRGPYLSGNGYAYTASVEMARAKNKSVQVTKRTDNQALDPRYPTGVPPVLTPNIFVAAPQALNFSAGDLVTQDLAGYVTGTDASGYVMSLVPVTGTLAGVGLTLNSNTIIFGTAVQANFTYRLRVTKSGYTFDAPTTSQIIVAAAAVTVIPIRAPFFTVTPDQATPKNDLAWDWANGDVEIWRGVDGATPALYQTRTAPGTQPALTFTGTTLGGATPATFNRSGNDITISNVVDGGFANASDLANLMAAAVTLGIGQSVNCTLPVFAGDPNSEAGIGIRQALVAMSPSVQLARRPDASNSATPMLSRATQGGTVTWKADATVNGLVDARIVRPNSTDYRFDQYALNNILAITTHTVPMSGGQYAYAYCNRVLPGAAISAQITNVYVNALGTGTYSDTSVSGGHVYVYLIRTKVGASFSEFSAPISATIQLPATGVIKFGPGILDQFTPPAVNGISGYRPDLAVHLNALKAHIDRIRNITYIRGLAINVYWAAVEGDIAGQYKTQWLQDILDYAQAAGKLIYLRVETGVFGGYASIYDIYPRYIVDNATTYGVTPLVSLQNGAYKGQTSCNWKVGVADRINAYMAFFGNLFNNHPAMEFIKPIGETSISVQNGVQGFSPEAFAAQIIRSYPLWRQAWPSVSIGVGVNDMGADANIISLYEAGIQYYIAFGGPDVWPGDVDQSLKIFKGLIGGKDYSSILDWTIEAQYQSFQGRWTIAQLWGAMVNGYTGADDGITVGSPKCRRLIMYVNEATGTAAQKYETGEKPFYASVNGRVYQESGVTPVPSSYPAVIRR